MAIAQRVTPADELADYPALSGPDANHSECTPGESKTHTAGAQAFFIRGPGTMPLETINVVMGLAFFSVWALVGRILVSQHIN